MYFFKRIDFFVVILLFLSSNLFASASFHLLIFSSGKAEIKLQDHLHHPYYWWPNTLLSYPIIFEENTVFEKLVLIDQKSGKIFPFQLTDFETTVDGKTKAILNFIADLPSGGSYDLNLKNGIPEKCPKLSAERHGNQIIVQTDKLSVWLPASRKGGRGTLPGPVLGIARKGKTRMGKSTFLKGQRELKRLDTKLVSVGPLFVEISIHYLFSDGASYQANIRCIRGYDFVEIKEQMSNFPDNEACCWEINWTGFSPTHRQAPNHPYYSGQGLQEKKETGFRYFNWEKIDQKMLKGHLGIIQPKDSTRIPFEIDVYGNYPAEKTVTSSVFWDDRSMQSVGIFMNNALDWNDGKYSVWRVSGRLSVNFYYKNGQLQWKYPLSNGTRSTALSCYDHQKDIDYMDDLWKKHQPQHHPSGFTYSAVRMSQLSYNSFLQNRYGTIHLNKIKDWVLTYPDSLPLEPAIFKKGELNFARDLEQDFLYGDFVLELPVSGPCQNSGYGPTSNRQFYWKWIDALNRLLPEMSFADRERFMAMSLFQAYVAAGEEYMPMRNMLSGHPNFLADVKSTPAMVAFLFPEHPEAKNWSALFGKYIDLNTHFHTRPYVKNWNSKGGRWTENLGTYVWAYLKPSLRANYLLQNYLDGVNHLTNANNTMIASWLLNSLSAPYNGESLNFYKNDNGGLDNHYWGIVTKENGPRRVHPPQGAHSARRMPSASFWLLGKALENYAPLLSENIRYVSHPDDQEMEVLDKKDDPFSIMYPDKNYDLGTPPDFKSDKFTGYGVILRAAVGTKDELSIHLQQIDQGPNYRWGWAADGGCGNVYFYAAGKSYSHNGKEDSGDRRVQDTDLITNFGVFKDGRFKSIGMNVLSEPMYDLGTGQFAEIVSSKRNKYSWPEYKGRSIMLVGSDYFILYDDVHDNNIGGRLSWFTHPLEDLPEIVIIKARGMGSSSNNGKVDKTELTGKESKGVWYDGTGDFMTFISHKKGYQTERAPYGAVITSPQGLNDYIFRNDTPVEVNDTGLVFSGTAGFIREREAGQEEWALFHGTRIGNTDLQISTSNPDTGISAVYSSKNEINGQYDSREMSQIGFQWSGMIPSGVRFYLDGIPQPVTAEGQKMIIRIPAGKHIWNLTEGLPDLLRPDIDYTQNEKGEVLLGIHPVPGSTGYRFEYSTDVGKSWTKLKQQSSVSLKVSPREVEPKGYIRVFALNNVHESEASVIYPVYFTKERPHYPDGLKLDIKPVEIRLTWGKVLGCREYKLYRREKGSKKFHLIYRGKEPFFTDRLEMPGMICEYAVSAVNGNGESFLSHVADNDSSDWLNFDPRSGEPFRRTASQFDVDNDHSGSPVLFYYPE